MESLDQFVWYIVSEFAIPKFLFILIDIAVREYLLCNNFDQECVSVILINVMQEIFIF